MTPLSGRYAKPLVALLLAFGIPVLALALWPRRQDDCQNPSLLMVTSLIEGSVPRGEPARRHAPGVVQWSQGDVVDRALPKQRMRFQIVRSYETQALYTAPTRLIGETLDAETHELIQVDTPAGPLPVHVAVDHTRQPSRIAAWAFVFGGRPTEDPFLTILADAPRRLLEGSRPLTVLIVDGAAPREEVEQMKATAERWLGAAWVQAAAACP